MCVDARAAAAPMIVVAVLASGCNAILGPSQHDDNWTSHDSARFSLHARPGSFAAEQAGYLAEVLEDQYDTALGMLGAQYGGRISGFLFASAAELDREFDRTGTAYPATESFAAVCVPPLDDGLLGLLAHEANHVVIENSLGRPGTSFMAEGLASAVLSERYHRAGRPFLYSWTFANRGRLPAVSRSWTTAVGRRPTRKRRTTPAHHSWRSCSIRTDTCRCVSCITCRQASSRAGSARSMGDRSRTPKPTGSASPRHGPPTIRVRPVYTSG